MFGKGKLINVLSPNRIKKRAEATPDILSNATCHTVMVRGRVSKHSSQIIETAPAKDAALIKILGFGG